MRGVGAAVAGELAHARGDVAGRVVQRLGAELAQEVLVALRGGGDHARAARDRELHGDVADATGAAADEQRLAAADAHRLERLVGGQADQRERRGLLEGELARLVGEVGVGGGDVLGVGPELQVVAADVAVDLVAGLERGHRRRRPARRRPRRPSRGSAGSGRGASPSCSRRAPSCRRGSRPPRARARAARRGRPAAARRRPRGSRRSRTTRR